MSLFILNSVISVEKYLELKLAASPCIEFLHEKERVLLLNKRYISLTYLLGK